MEKKVEIKGKFYGASFEKMYCGDIDKKLYVEMAILECCIEAVIFRQAPVEHTTHGITEGLYLQFLRTQAVIE